MRKAIQLLVALETEAAATPERVKQLTAQAIARFADGASRYPQLTFTVKGVEQGPTGTAVRLWVAGDAEPASNFFQLTTEAARDILVGDHTLMQADSLVVQDICEDRRDADDADAEVSASTTLESDKAKPAARSAGRASRARRRKR